MPRPLFQMMTASCRTRHTRPFAGIVLACAVLGAATPAAADDGRNAPAFREPEQIVRGLVRERDVSVLFDYLRQSMAAAIRGREPPQVPEELVRRAEAVGEALKAQGALAAHAALAELEREAKRALREIPSPRPALPPAQPFIRL